MTVTDTDAPSTEMSEATTLAPPVPATGFAALIGSGDHKTIGRLWIATAFLFLAIAGLSGLALGAEQIDLASNTDILPVGDVGQVYSLHFISAIFLFAVPLLIGLGTYVTPLQVGANSVAFPRASAAAYWTFLVSGLIVLASFIADGGPGGSDLDAVALFVAGFVALLAALTLAAISVGTTGIAMRAEGMGLHRTPLFTWANIAFAGIWVITLPVLAGLMILSYVDLRYGQTFLGGSAGLFPRLAWAWSQPTIYVFAIPVLGIIGDIVPVAAKTRITLHRVAMGAIAGFAMFAFGAWAMPGFGPAAATPLEYTDEIVFLAFSALIAVPLLALAGLLADTLRRGKPDASAPLVFAIGSLLALLASALVGALISIDGLELVGTTATEGHFYLVVGAIVLGGFAGVTFWAPKIWGSSIPNLPAAGLASLILIGTLILGLADTVTGFLGQIAGLGGATDDVSTIESLNLISLVGGGLLVVGAAAFVALVAKTAFGSHDAEDDPWGGHTLEWTIASPPPVHNFDSVIPVTSEAPLYDARNAGEADS